MVKVETTHRLLTTEIFLLRELIGKSLSSIYSPGADLAIGVSHYNFLEAINLKFDGGDGFVAIVATYDETMFGDDLIRINIQKQKDPVGIKRHEKGGLLLPFVHLSLPAEFIVRKIEVFGESYLCQSENNKKEPYWKIERDHPGQAIVENIETENAFVFHSDKERLLIQPSGPQPWINVCLDSQSIDNTLQSKYRDDETMLKLKHEIE